MKIIYSELFRKYPELVFGISTKEEKNSFSPAPLFLNMGLSVGDDEKNVKNNRELFFKELKINYDEVVYQKQVHSCNIKIAKEPGFIMNNDSLISNKEELFLAVQVADCAPVFIYDPVNKVFAGIHSGWKGAECNISGKTIESMYNSFNSKPADLIAYTGPCISVNNYQVGIEFKKVFKDKYFDVRDENLYFDLKGVIFDQLLAAGLKKENIEMSDCCTFGDRNDFHSHRREKGNTGRMMGIIGLRPIKQ
ncbi:peptidoglycan editing factor PgeF [soil metagenome]